MMKEWIANRNKDEILNMDQTPITYSVHPMKTLEAKGTKAIQVPCNCHHQWEDVATLHDLQEWIQQMLCKS